MQHRLKVFIEIFTSDLMVSYLPNMSLYPTKLSQICDRVFPGDTGLSVENNLRSPLGQECAITRILSQWAFHRVVHFLIQFRHIRLQFAVISQIPAQSAYRHCKFFCGIVARVDANMSQEVDWYDEQG